MEGGKKKIKLFMACLFLFIFLPLTYFISTIPLAHAQTENVPSNKWKFTEDYFTVYASPQIVVSLRDNIEYERDDSDTVQIQIMNQGKILGFESEREPADDNEIQLSKMEKQMESDATKALGVVANLRAKDAPLDIKSSPQSVGSLASGQVSEPIQFEVKVWKNASAGTYPLEVDLSYQYQKDVYLEGDASNNMIDSKILYQEVNETHDIFIVIKREADFEVTAVESELYPGSTEPVSITFKNTGEETAFRALARLRLSDPLSSTDYTAFLEDMEPGEEVQAVFNIEVDSDSISKPYPIKAEVEYENSEGETLVSDTIYVPAEVRESKEEGVIFRNPLLLTGVALGLVVIAYFHMRHRKKEGKRGKSREEDDSE